MKLVIKFIDSEYKLIVIFCHKNQTLFCVKQKIYLLNICQKVFLNINIFLTHYFYF